MKKKKKVHASQCIEMEIKRRYSLADSRNEAKKTGETI